MSAGNSRATTWPADIIHVNEDGWVLINRGSRDGVATGLRVLVVGQGIRQLRNLFVGGDGESGQDLPVVLHTRRTYELLQIVHVEDSCAVAIATRTPAERRPSFYRGPDGELLVWVPLPPDYLQPQGNDDIEGPTGEPPAESGYEPEAGDGVATDEPPAQEEQEDELWEQSLPLNSVNVGDIVVPALPVQTSASGAAPGASSTPANPAPEPTPEPTPYEQGRTYDWMKPAE